MSASKSVKRQPLRWRSQTAARDAVDRVKRGGSVKNDTHVRKLIEVTVEARYCRQGKLKVSPGAVVTLALSFTAAEWAAVNRDPVLLQETLDYFKTGDFQIDRWWTYWRNLQVVQPKLAKLFLLEIIYEYWKDDVTELIDGVVHISNGLPVVNLVACQADEPAPKRLKANSHYAPPLGKPYKGSKCDIQTEPYLDSVPIPQQSDAAQTGAATTLLRAIRFEKRTLQEIVLERPDGILGGIWFGSPAGFQPLLAPDEPPSSSETASWTGHQISHFLLVCGGNYNARGHR